MRLGSIILLSAATLFASCASTTTDLGINQVAVSGHGVKDTTGKRNLRTKLESEEDGEERGGKVLPAEILNKIPGEFRGETLPGEVVKKLLRDESFRRDTFREWRITVGVDDLGIAMNLNKKGRLELLQKYEDYIREV
ncbi:unnamed protein product [Phytophthora lilii]|uniref:RxLR effector protein n=1 Tax=Phytophthora lilii TaxID=2077276 RepID=A0A9W6WQB8_9STRA|nr:unnamed protein product [Phytophthora lilii]